jgi:hypothetical protein
MGDEIGTTPIPTFPLRGKEISSMPRVISLALRKEAISSLPKVISLPLRGRVRVGVLLIEGAPLE